MNLRTLRRRRVACQLINSRRPRLLGVDWNPGRNRVNMTMDKLLAIAVPAHMLGAAANLKENEVKPVELSGQQAYPAEVALLTREQVQQRWRDLGWGEPPEHCLPPI